MYSSRKNPYPPHGRSLKIPRGRGVLKVKMLEAKYEAKLEFPGGRGGGGAKQKREYGYILELHHLLLYKEAYYIKCLTPSLNNGLKTNRELCLSS